MNPFNSKNRRAAAKSVFSGNIVKKREPLPFTSPRFARDSPRTTKVWRSPWTARWRAALPVVLLLAGEAGWLSGNSVVAPLLSAHSVQNAAVLPAALPEGHAVESYAVASPFAVDRDQFVLIDKGQHTLSLYRRVQTLPVAVGKNPGDKQAVGDCRTPECAPDTVFPIQKKQHTPAGSQFGPRFVELSTPKWTGIAIHGTDAPQSIGTDSSHGCVRLNNPAIRWLYEQVQIGDNVLIRP